MKIYVKEDNKRIQELLQQEDRILDTVLYALKMEDIHISYKMNGELIAHDADNIWHGKEFYDFLINEAIVYESDGSSTVISDEQLEKVLELGKYHGVVQKE